MRVPSFQGQRWLVQEDHEKGGYRFVPTERFRNWLVTNGLSTRIKTSRRELIFHPEQFSNPNHPQYIPHGFPFPPSTNKVYAPPYFYDN